MSKKALIAMSGGVDSSASALIMKNKGYECLGITMKLFYEDQLISGDGADPEADGRITLCREHTCCSADDVEDARKVASMLGIPFYVFNFSERFRECVIDPFVHAYENGITPNPCIDCNRHLKFDKLFARARELEYDYVVTGHYARIRYDEPSGRWQLLKGLDPGKDQSYVLYSMTQDQLAHTIFPLGEMNKSDVRDLAEAAGLLNARKHDSQDICFVADGKYSDFIKNYTGRTYPAGDFTDMEGNVLGQHKGIIHYTVGQRKGLGLALKEPMYVGQIDPESNTVRLCKNAELFSTSLTARDINLISVDRIDQPMRVKAKVRYKHTEQWATVVQTGDDELQVTFDEPQRAITRGQALVMYDGDVLVGGGIITETSCGKRV